MSLQDESSRYEAVLRPLFFTKTDALELACTLVGISGMADGGWDTVEESRQLLLDLTRLRDLPFSRDVFPRPNDTTARVCLLGYVHLVEMSAPYHMLVNLLRIHLGNRYHLDPFGDLSGTKKKVSQTKPQRHKRKPSPSAKIARIKQWAAARGVPDLGVALDEVYSSKLRNAVAHSDYVLWNDEFRIGAPPQRMSMVDVWQRIDRALGFYSAFFALEIETRAVFRDAKGQRLPVDGGELEFLVDDDGLLFGFRFYWSDGGTSECSRSRGGRVARNVWTLPNGELEFLTGMDA